MGRKPVLSVAGTLLTSLALAGCQSTSSTRPVGPTATTATASGQTGSTGGTPIASSGQVNSFGQPIQQPGQSSTQFGQATQFGQGGSMANPSFGPVAPINPNPPLSPATSFNSSTQFGQTNTTKLPSTPTPGFMTPPAPMPVAPMPQMQPAPAPQPLNTISNSAPVILPNTGLQPVAYNAQLPTGGQFSTMPAQPPLSADPYRSPAVPGSSPFGGPALPPGSSAMPTTSTTTVYPALPPQGLSSTPTFPALPPQGLSSMTTYPALPPQGLSSSSPGTFATGGNLTMPPVAAPTGMPSNVQLIQN